MKEITISSFGHDLELKINIKADMPSDDAYTSDVILKMLVHLIEETDTNLWQKDHRELQPDEFYAALLTAIARHYASDDPMERQQPIYQWLNDLIANLRDNNHLHQIV